MRLSTPRLELVAATLDLATAELESPERLGEMLHADVDSDWPPGEYDRDAQDFFRDCLEKGGSEAIGWYCWYAIRKADARSHAVLVGAGGYFGPPNENGEAEIGFSIVPKWRDQGYATELAKALVEKAFTDPRVQKVLAHTTSENKASCSVLHKVGFQTTTTENTDSLGFEITR